MPHSRKASNSALGVLRQIGPGGGFGVDEEGRGVLLHQAVQRGLLGAVTLKVDRHRQSFGGAGRLSAALADRAVL